MARPAGVPSSRSVDIARRRAQALELRRAGVSWQDIANRLGYKSRSAACQDVRRAMEDIVRVPAQQHIAEEVDRLDAMLQGLWPSARKGGVQSIDRVLKIMDRRARYLGLDNGLRSDSVEDARSMLGELSRALGVVAGTPPAGE